MCSYRLNQPIPDFSSTRDTLNKIGQFCLKAVVFCPFVPKFVFSAYQNSIDVFVY
jgi:hypothetical protein